VLERVILALGQPFRTTLVCTVAPTHELAELYRSSAMPRVPQPRLPQTPPTNILVCHLRRAFDHRSPDCLPLPGRCVAAGGQARDAPPLSPATPGESEDCEDGDGKGQDGIGDGDGDGSGGSGRCRTDSRIKQSISGHRLSSPTIFSISSYSSSSRERPGPGSDATHTWRR